MPVGNENEIENCAHGYRVGNRRCKQTDVLLQCCFFSLFGAGLSERDETIAGLILSPSSV